VQECGISNCGGARGSRSAAKAQQEKKWDRGAGLSEMEVYEENGKDKHGVYEIKNRSGCDNGGCGYSEYGS